jgi:hypothetical protein
MFFQINVSHEGLHVFATAEHSLTGFLRAREVYTLLREKFPESEGYAVVLRKVEVSSTVVSLIVP